MRLTKVHGDLVNDALLGTGQDERQLRHKVVHQTCLILQQRSCEGSPFTQTLQTEVMGQQLFEGQALLGGMRTAGNSSSDASGGGRCTYSRAEGRKSF